jgi:uncharacterized protein YgiM (DUF1202 family)
MTFHKAAILVLALFLPVTALAAEGRQKAVSKVSRLRIRENPKLDSEIIGFLAKGESVRLLDKSTFTYRVEDQVDYWCRVETSTGVRGWVFGGYLKIEPTPKEPAAR